MFLTIVVVLLVADELDVFIAIAGSIFGMINVLLLPAIAHYKLVATTNKEKYADFALMGFAIVMMIFLPCTIIWTNVKD